MAADHLDHLARRRFRMGGLATCGVSITRDAAVAGGRGGRLGPSTSSIAAETCPLSSAASRSASTTCPPRPTLTSLALPAGRRRPRRPGGRGSRRSAAAGRPGSRRLPGSPAGVRPGEAGDARNRPSPMRSSRARRSRGHAGPRRGPAKHAQAHHPDRAVGARAPAVGSSGPPAGRRDRPGCPVQRQHGVEQHIRHRAGEVRIDHADELDPRREAVQVQMVHPGAEAEQAPPASAPTGPGPRAGSRPPDRRRPTAAHRATRPGARCPAPPPGTRGPRRAATGSDL